VASPSASAELPPGSLANSKSATAGRAGSSTGSSGPGILGRVIRTLEFWR
jgi:hypothetical protein